MTTIILAIASWEVGHIPDLRKSSYIYLKLVCMLSLSRNLVLKTLISAFLSWAAPKKTRSRISVEMHAISVINQLCSTVKELRVCTWSAWY